MKNKNFKVDFRDGFPKALCIGLIGVGAVCAALLLLITFGGCGKKTAKTNDTAIDTTTFEREETASQFTAYQPSEEIKSAALDSHKFQVGDTVLQFPCTVGEILDAGAVFEDANITDNAFLPGSEIKTTASGNPYEYDYHKRKYMLVLNDQEILIYVFNTSENDMPLRDCSIQHISVTRFEKDQNREFVPCFFFPGGLALDDVNMELYNAYKPFFSEPTFFVEYDKIDLMVTVDTNSAKIVHLKYTYTPNNTIE